MKQRKPTPQEEHKPTARTKRALALAAALDLWNADARAQGFSDQYLYTRTANLKNFLWWLENEANASPTLDSLTSATVREFLGYLREPAPEGRFKSTHPNARKQMRPATLNRYFRDLRAFVNFLTEEGLLAEGALHNVKPPKVPKDQVVPLTSEEVTALLAAAASVGCPERNRAILLLLLDTGLRLSELCSLSLGAIRSNCVEVVGKGNKKRTVYFGKTARRALNTYVTRFRRDADPGEPLFVAIGGIHAGDGLTPTGVYQLIRSLAREAKINGKRVSPHVMRHTFCVNFLRNGGNLFTLQQLVGHESIDVLRRYVFLGANDLAVAHRLASPADSLKLQ